MELMTIRSLFIRVFTYVFLMMAAQCALAEESAFFNVVVKGSTLINITTTVPNKTYANAGIKINSPSYSLAGVGTECTQSPTTGYCLFSVSDTASKNISLTGSGDTLSLTLCLDGTGNSSSTCQNYNVSMVTTTPRFAYFTDSGSTPVHVCTLSATTGLITSCQSAGFDTLLPSAGTGITLNNTSTMAYITWEGTTSPTMYQCAINAVDGTFTSCAQQTIYAQGSGNAYYPYYGMPGLNASNSILYLNDGYNLSAGRVLACKITGNTLSSECTDTGATGLLYEITGITTTQVAGQTYAYIGDGYDNHTMSVCAVSSDGLTFSGCVQKTGGGTETFAYPMMAVFNASGTMAYISDYDNGVYACSTTPNNTSKFSNCILAWDGGGLSIDYLGIAIGRNGRMAYVSGYSSVVAQCPILSTGYFGTCTQFSSVMSSFVAVALGY
jgi:hypothetical protein